jgi:hypothetical protein
MSTLPTIDQNTLGWIITSGIVAIFIAVVVTAVRLERRISRLEGRVETLEENPFLVAVRQFQITQAEEMLRGWEENLRNKLSKDKDQEGQKTI